MTKRPLPLRLVVCGADLASRLLECAARRATSHRVALALDNASEHVRNFSETIVWIWEGTEQ